MSIDELDKLIEKSKMFGNMLSITKTETFPNVHPTIKNPLNHLNDIQIQFAMYKNNIFSIHMLSEITTLDFFNAMDKIANSKSEKYNKWKQRELRNYNIDKILENE